MNILLYYILGACISGFIFSLLKLNNSFYEFLDYYIEKISKELKNSEELGDAERIILDNNIDNKDVIKFLNKLVVLSSWIGILINLNCIFEYIKYLKSKK